MQANKVSEKEICHLFSRIVPPFKRLSWWKFNDAKYFLLLGYWYCEQRSEWRMEFLELGEKQSIIRPESKFQNQIDEGLMVEYLKK